MTQSPNDRQAMPPHNRTSLPLVVVVVGPTAVGKSDLALTLCQRLSGELISADSRQIYRYLDIGTAKPSAAERSLVRHHIVDVVNPDEEYTLADFQRDAYQAIDAALSRNHLPVVAGGSGLYIKAVVEGLRIPRIAPQPALRQELEARAQREGPLALHGQLEAIDPTAAARIDARNVRRVIRALEVCLVSGQPITSLQSALTPAYDFLSIGVTTEREALFQRIDVRVEQQFAAGLVEETQRAVSRGYDYALPSMSGLGQRQAGLYLQGKLSLAEAIQLDKFDTHRFARQQYNWFRLNDPRIIWFSRAQMSWDDLVRQAMSTVLDRLSAAA